MGIRNMAGASARAVSPRFKAGDQAWLQWGQSKRMVTVASDLGACIKDLNERVYRVDYTPGHVVDLPAEERAPHHFYLTDVGDSLLSPLLPNLRHGPQRNTLRPSRSSRHHAAEGTGPPCVAGRGVPQALPRPHGRGAGPGALAHR